MGARAVFVFIGGGFGAITRELLMLLIPQQNGAFPLDIFTANVVASFCLGAAFELNRLKQVSDAYLLLIGTGFAGGMSTFSSFVYGITSEASSPGQAGLAVFYALSSLIVGYAAIWLGIASGKRLRRA
ncbi:camphor resistance protein CrcB [Methylobacterium sp. Leaf123]|uniref:fluoride efflux transporter CrcB n=1 Tax=Methylobacterium sp. Leaf123 TaxID=1736264 RepID=UPI0006F2B312|nr:fluoride efflux transporter CrcB [Methylobacterium sp. Leaf123]KQQ25350.1 camphor resistance protein CrcB [Methylobacterium sp. Leaf123]